MNLVNSKQEVYIIFSTLNILFFDYLAILIFKEAISVSPWFFHMQCQKIHLLHMKKNLIMVLCSVPLLGWYGDSLFFSHNTVGINIPFQFGLFPHPNWFFRFTSIKYTLYGVFYIALCPLTNAQSWVSITIVLIQSIPLNPEFMFFYN